METATKEPSMSQIKKILCPTDWSEPSRVALQAAVNIERHEKAELVLLHVLPHLGMVRGIVSVVPLGQVVQEEAFQKLTVLIAECVPPDVPVQPLIRIGDEADEIHRAALQADLVVMSTHGRSGWAHWAFGSIAESVLRESVCPIFVVGPSGITSSSRGAEKDGRGCCFDFPYKQVLWPTDWSDAADRALDEAIAIAAHHGAQLLLLHVIEPPRRDLSDSAQSQDQAEDTERHFIKLCERKAGAQNARHLICHGVAADEITRVAVAEGADLVVMSSHGRTGWQRLKLGSVAQKVLRQVPCPVFLVPHSGDVSPVVEAQPVTWSARPH
jgi:nucleotide-binding universal stress UspA family protein